MDHLMDFAISMARESGALLKERFNTQHTIDYKGEIDIVTETDRLSEKLLTERIIARFPQHDILAEESPEICKGSEYRWIIDPLDGTTNYAHGFPVFCVSIALEHNRRSILGVIFNPMLNELFTAEKGGGAYLNGEAISVSATDLLIESLLATGFPYDIRVDPNNNINYFAEMALRSRAIRRAGSAALDLAYLAAGRFDGFWELKLHPWDTAAAQLLVTEAGGTVTDLSGENYDIFGPSIVASNGRIHDAMIGVLAEVDPLDRRIQR